MAQHIAKYNNEIRDWVETRKQSGQVSELVERACLNIGYTLQILSHMSFIMPHTDDDINEYDRYLNEKLSELVNKNERYVLVKCIGKQKNNTF
jgi:hypothetical protein